MIYRSKSGSVDLDEVKTPHDTMREPGNVSYVVDNLWEWARPERFPTRRKAKFANPTRKLARENGGDGDGTVYRVAFEDGHFTLCQLVGCTDARYHSDCRDLRKAVVGALGRDWCNASPGDKQEAGQLFMPCLRREEVEQLFQSVDPLREARSDIYEAVTYWSDVEIVDDPGDLPDDEGELFFSYPGGFRLEPIEAK